MNNNYKRLYTFLIELGEDFLLEDMEDLINIVHQDFPESQPTAGGVKEEDDRPLNDKEIIEWYIMKVNHLKIALAHQETVLETKEEEIRLLKSHR